MRMISNIRDRSKVQGQGMQLAKRNEERNKDGDKKDNARQGQASLRLTRKYQSNRHYPIKMMLIIFAQVAIL